MSFEQLLGKLSAIETLAKALPAAENDDDKKIKAAAGDDGNVGKVGGGDVEDDDLDENGKKKKPSPIKEGDDDAPMAKSFSLMLEDGSQVEAFDGGPMLKALTDRLQITENAMASNEENILKSLNVAVDLISAQAVQLQEQGSLIKSLTGKVNEMASTGRGRVSTLTVTEKPQLETSLKKSLPAQMGREELLQKSNVAMKNGRISGIEAAGIETRLNMNIPIDPQLIQRISSN